MYAVATLLATGIGVVVAQSPAAAHGAMMMPGSRTYLCWKDGLTSTGAIQPNNPACAAAVAQSGTTALYNWFSVLRSDGAGRMAGFIPDGQLCSGGTGGPYDFTGFNLARNDWPVTHLTSGATMRFDYNDWAKHPGTFSLYITKDSWSPTRPLAWSDLESTPFSQVTNPTAVGGPGTEDGRYSWNGTLPSGKSGRHLIYSVWARSDSQETFYGCSDVVFDGGHGEVTGVGGGGTTPPTTPPTTTPTTPPTTPPTTSPTTPPAQGGCTAMYAITGGWDGGFQGEVMVHAGDRAISNWTVSWTFPGSQRVTQLWSGKATSSGSLVTVSNESWNGTVAAGDHTTFGFLGSGTAPTTVQNLTCSTT
ncbi:chitin-binding protein [Mangrovihabitans endophyticus]|uniref:Chitin-binding protein n=2 Tax=Mangrovihabitans endophyticus TaxID=1751298 RepID=A0A8J3C4B7_9ACTN|nr:lytic polysaccharide monooxygenase [Mangrovihabitans endophyticus]GGL16835.1 chitin-binding protein [Mangrovihabitans endophyticus]